MSATRICAVILGLIAAVPASCGSQTVHSTGVVSMDIGGLSPVEIGVLTPSRRFIFMYSDEFKCRGVSIKDGRVTIETSNAVGYYWDLRGERREVAVFAEAGAYTIFVSDNLETETENSSAITRRYVNKNPQKTTVSSGGCENT